MEFKIKNEKGVTIITLKGEVIGGPDATELRRQLHSLIDQGKKNIVVDLGQVELMNSSGLGMLIGGLTTVRNAGGDLRLANASAKILSLFTVTKLSKIADRLEAGEGSAGKLLKDPSVYNNVDQMLVETRSLVKAIRENPKRYLTIHLKLF